MGAATEILDAIVNAPKSSTGWMRVNCPLCPTTKGTKDKRHSLGVNAESGGYKCFRCGAKGKLPGYGDSTAPSLLRDTDVPTIPTLPGFLPCSEDGPNPVYTHNYFIGRGISANTITQVGAGCVTEINTGAATYKGLRAVVPVLAPYSEDWVGWVARDLTDRSTRRYLNAPGDWAGHTMFNQEALYDPLHTPIIVVEGVFDALPYYPAAVALLGKASEGQLQLLYDTARPIVVALDGDAADECWSLAAQLVAYGARAKWVRLPPKQDPSSIGRAKFIELVRGAQDVW